MAVADTKPYSRKKRSHADMADEVEALFDAVGVWLILTSDYTGARYKVDWWEPLTGKRGSTTVGDLKARAKLLAKRLAETGSIVPLAQRDLTEGKEFDAAEAEVKAARAGSYTPELVVFRGRGHPRKSTWKDKDGVEFDCRFGDMKSRSANGALRMTGMAPPKWDAARLKAALEEAGREGRVGKCSAWTGVYVNSVTPITYRCSDGEGSDHDSSIRPNDLSHGYGCRTCNLRGPITMKTLSRPGGRDPWAPSTVYLVMYRDKYGALWWKVGIGAELRWVDGDAELVIHWRMPLVMALYIERAALKVGGKRADNHNYPGRPTTELFEDPITGRNEMWRLRGMLASGELLNLAAWDLVKARAKDVAEKGHPEGEES